MGTRASLLAAGLAALVVLAGCSVGPAPSSTPSKPATTSRTPSPTPSPEVTVRGDLPADADRVFRRVQRLLGVDVEPPTVFVTSRSGYLDRVNDTRSGFGPFLTALGFGSPPLESAILRDAVGAVTLSSGNVVVYAAENATRVMVECLLAHEFVHVIQVRTGAYDAVRSAHTETWYGRTLDAVLARRATTEGAAVLIGRRYEQRYGDCGGVGLSAYRERARNGSVTRRLLAGPYYRGWQYVSWRVDGAGDLGSVYERPPLTTEQVLHNHSREAEPPADLSVRFDDGDSDWQPVYRRTLGELVVKSTLSGELSRERAERAAAGWGNDTVLQLSSDGSRPSLFAWVTRWDDPGEADQFAAAIGEYLDARFRADGTAWADPDGRRWALRRMGNETVTLLVGPPTAVERLRITGTDPVVVAVADGEASSSPVSTSSVERIFRRAGAEADARTGRYEAVATEGPLDDRERRARVRDGHR